MPLIRSTASEHRAYIVAIILSLGKIMPTYSYYILKGLVCVIIAALSSYQPSSCSKCIKLNIYLSCDIKLVSNAKYIYLIHFYIL